MSLALLPLALGVGAAVDYARIVNAGARLQNAADSAVLALTVETAPPANPSNLALAHVRASMADTTLDNLQVIARRNADGSYTVDAAGDLPNAIMSLIRPSSRIARSAMSGAVAGPAAASFAIGSRLVQLNGGVLNAVLGGLLGGSLSLAAMDYEALARVNVDLFEFSSALATQAGLTAVTYDQLLQSNVSVASVIRAAQAAPSMSSQGSQALAKILAATAPGSSQLRLGQLVDFGRFGSLAIGQKPITASVSALDLLSATGQIANGRNMIAAAVDAGLPGLASVSLQMTVGERPVNVPLLSVGEPGASVHTAQTRILLNLQVVGTGQTALVNLPLYVEIAAGAASLASIACTAGPSSAVVGLAVSPAVVDAWIGSVGVSEMTNFTQAPSPKAANLLNLALASVSALGHVKIGNVSPTQVAFSYSDIVAATRKTVSTSAFTTSLLASLLGQTQIKVNVLGLGIGVPGDLDDAVLSTLGGATGAIDQVLANLLAAAGVGLGQADVWVSGVECGSGSPVAVLRR